MIHILTINVGSSSVKASLFAIQDPKVWSENVIWNGLLEWGLNQKNSSLTITHGGTEKKMDVASTEIEVGINMMVETLWSGDLAVLKSPHDVSVVGHRIVHGGEKWSGPTVITSEVKEDIAALIPLAPLHNPNNLKGILAIEKLLPDTPQIAIFDTAFHHGMPSYAATYAIPYKWRQEGIRRYGFHGISHQYCSRRAANLLDRDIKDLKIITCHLGNGCSLAAVQNGKSIDTTMGFTPLEGLIMGTRSGSIDPGIILYFLQEKGLSTKEVDALLTEKSGLKGISEGFSDMRDIIKEKDTNPLAQLAYEMFLYSLKKHIGSFITVLNGIDALVFTGGIGENSPLVRLEACLGLALYGIEIEESKNRHSHLDRVISSSKSLFKVLVIKDREDEAMAHDCWALMQKIPGSS